MNSLQNEPKEVEMLSTNYVLNGKAGEIKYLIFHRRSAKDGEVVVYVDNDLELDWECDDKAGELIDTMPLKGAVRNILNGVAALEPISHSWPKDLKLTSKRLLGEAIASVLRDDVEGAEGALENAKKFVRAKSNQVSRYWTLQGCILAGILAAIFGGIEILNRIWVVSLVGRIPYLLSLCFWAGCIGALLFVVLRFGTQPKVDSTAEKHLHYIEAIARILGGGIAGVLVGAMVKLGLILPVFGQAGMETLAMCAAAMIAGASERLAAGIVTKVENSETGKQESDNADN